MKKSVPFTELECPKCKSRNYTFKFYKKDSTGKLVCNNCGTIALVEIYAKIYQVKEHEE